MDDYSVSSTIVFLSAKLSLLRQRVKMENRFGSKPKPATIKLKPIEATPETFQEFGQVVEASDDGDLFSSKDAQLDLTHGIPRLYIMKIEKRPLEFASITHHARVTQCLGSIGGHEWYLGVARPSLLENSNESESDLGKNGVKALSGHLYEPPRVEEIRVFKIAGSKFIKLNRGTWHAGPIFKAESMDFYNLELTDTNLVDHTTHHFKENGVVFFIDD
ncbi:hypothetical protein CsatB_009667 [Cannabis sativa]|uniref:Ureidoglycolate hydrolase n=3 Tax=Cannabis sativa TaxID=3483 RepID=A0AB40ECB3_CANSA|nr:uncharacterized protein LOC115708282 [Cannabis sativa]KAF4382242.1 hypothetical protein G4B88_011571 [Cannabis sativa]